MRSKSGVGFGLACDFVVAREGVVFNPHYKSLGLTGSEYHTYILPKRVGEAKAKELLNACLPISVESAKSMGIVDAVYAHEEYYEELHTFASSKFDDEFWKENSEFHELRREFVWKVCARETPERFKQIED